MSSGRGRQASDPETGLTAKQEAFCIEFAKTGDASASYRKAYNAQNMKPETVSRTAFEIQKKPKIAARLSQLRSDIRKSGVITLEEHIKTLGILRNKAAEAKQYSAAITAEVSRGKVSGLYEGAALEEDSAPVKKVEIRIVDGRKNA
jgi:phage terminase small subunit